MNEWLKSLYNLKVNETTLSLKYRMESYTQWQDITDSIHDILLDAVMIAITST